MRGYPTGCADMEEEVMAEIQWSPVIFKDGPGGFWWCGLTSRQFQEPYWRVFMDERYAQIVLTPGERPRPDNVAELISEMRLALPPEEGPDVPHHAEL